MKKFKDLREKKLTPAELKKREEIAKAMERDNPGMPMAKKMAIATATAKKVAEETELDEGLGHISAIQNMMAKEREAQAAKKKKANSDNKKDQKNMSIKVKEAKEDDEPASSDEASMALKQLEFIEYAAEEMMDHIKSGKAFPEWFQNKLSKAHGEIEGLHSAMGEHGGEDDEEDMKEAYRVHAVSKDGEKMKSGLHPTKKAASDMHYKMAKSGMYKKIEVVKETVELDEAETTYVIKHKKTKQVLSTHSNYNDAKDEHSGISDKQNYGIFKQTKKDAALRNRNTYREEVELDEAKRKGAPKMQGDFLKKERERNRAHDAAMGRTPTGRKKPVRTMTSTQRSLAKLRNETVMSADKKPEKYVKPDGKVGIRMVRTDKKVVSKDV